MADSSAPPAGSGIPATIGRWALLLLLAGHLLLRREFAHHNLGEIAQWLGIAQPSFLSYGFVTEVTLLLLFPLSLMTIWQTARRGSAPPGEAALQYGLGPAVFIAVSMLLWSGGHVIAGFFRQPHDAYLIFRQSALGAYAIVFIYTFIFFGNQARFVRQAAVFAVAVAVACAALDTAGLLNPKPGSGGQYPDEHLFGQQTLPLGILALGLYVIYVDAVPWRVAAVLALGFLGWRETRRELQSAVVVGIAGALAAYLILGVALAIRRQVNTLKRAILLVAFFGVIFLGYRAIHKSDSSQREMSAMSLETYERLFNIYESTQVPSESTIKSPRPPFETVTDPEAYKLNVVYELAQRKGGISVVNNFWRLLLWRKMVNDLQSGHPVVGAGVDKAWTYPALYQTRFHYGEEREGLDPHNSYLNVLYRYGVVGGVLFAALLVTVLIYVWKALRLQPFIGDPLLEGLTLFFFYSAIFAFFTVSLEGPSYSLPFWMSLGLLYAHARQNLAANADSVF